MLKLYTCMKFLYIFSAASASTTPPLGCYLLLEYEHNTECFHHPSRNTNYTHDGRIHRFTSNGNAASIRFIIGLEPAVCFEAVQFVSCLISSMPCNGENNLTLRVCDRSCQAFNRLMANTLCDDFNQRVLNLSRVDSFSVLQQVYREFNCSETSTYFGDNLTQFDDTKCTSIFSIQHEGWFIVGESARILPVLSEVSFVSGLVLSFGAISLEGQS